MKYQNSILIVLSLAAVLIAQPAKAVSCGDSITTNLTLTADLHCTTGFAALEVFANDITIDLNGFRLSGTTDLAGILTSGFDNLEVKGGVISGFWAGVNTGRSDGLKVHNTIIANVGHAVVIAMGNNAHLYDNDFLFTTASAVAINNRVAGLTANNNVVENNEFYQNFAGVRICGDDADFNVVRNNLIWQSSDYGVHLIQSSNNIINNNTILDAGLAAIRLNNSSFNTMRRNSLREGRIGLSILANAGGACLEAGRNKSHKNRFIGNHSSGFETGVFLGLGTVTTREVYRNRIIGNKLYNNDTGIYFNTDAHRNNATGNGYFGTTTEVTDMGVGNSY